MLTANRKLIYACFSFITACKISITSKTGKNYFYLKNYIVIHVYTLRTVNIFFLKKISYFLKIGKIAS